MGDRAKEMGIKMGLGEWECTMAIVAAAAYGDPPTAAVGPRLLFHHTGHPDHSLANRCFPWVMGRVTPRRVRSSFNRSYSCEIPLRMHHNTDTVRCYFDTGYALTDYMQRMSIVVHEWRIFKNRRMCH